MKYQKTYYTVCFDRLENTFLYRTDTHGFLTTSGEDTDGLILHNLTVTDSKVSGYFEDNGDHSGKDIFIKIIAKDQFDSIIGVYGCKLLELNKAFCFSINSEDCPGFYNQAINKPSVDFIIEFEFKDDYDDFSIENLQELMIKHGAIIRAIPEYEVNLLEPRHKDKYPDAEIIHDERYNRDYIRVKTKLSLGKKFIIGIKHNQDSKIWDDHWIRDPKTKKLLRFDNFKEIYDYLIKM